MRLLLDTQAVICWFVDPEALGAAALRAIAEDANHIRVSAASLWEMAIKFRLGKLPQAGPLIRDPEAIAAQGFVPLPITFDHAARAGALPAHHKDPFDRLLIAQAAIENLTVVSSDRLFDRYGVERIWR